MLTLRPPSRSVQIGAVSTRPPVIGPVAPPPSLVEFGSRRTLVVAGVMLAALLQTVDTTIVNVALPTIQGNLGASVDEGTWVVTAYVIANVVVIPLTPWMQRRFGRKNYFIASILGFTLASVLCGLSTTLPELVLFRIVQGAFGGGLLSTAQLILRDTFPQEQLGTSQAIFAVATILGPSIGPTLGGVITDNLSWAWVFDINILPGVFAAILLAFYLRDNASPRREPADVVGLLLLIVTIGSLQYVLDQGQTEDWFSSGTIVFLSTTALLGAVAFVWWELRTPTPIVDLRVLRYRAMVIASLTSMVNATVVFGLLLLIPQFTVDQLGFTSSQAGLLIGARALPVLFLTIPIGRIVNSGRVDLRFLIGGGLFIAGVGTVWFSQQVTTVSAFSSFVPALMLIGSGIAFVYSPLLVATLRSVQSNEGPKASAIVILATQLGGSIASASLVTLTDRRELLHQSTLAGAVTLAHPGVSSFLHGHSLIALYQTVVEQATALAYSDAFWVSGVLAMGFAPFLLLLSPSRQSPPRIPKV